MTDPPASTFTGGLLVLPDPVATGIAVGVDSPDEIVCTPCGSVEVSTQSFGTSTSDEENRKDKDHSEPPGVFLRRDMVRYNRRSKTPVVDVDADAQAGEPLIGNDGENRISPILQLPLPPSDGFRKRSSVGSAGATTANSTPNTATSKSASLMMKAERYSALKKRKGPNNLLNRLFCSTPSGGGGSRTEEDPRGKERARGSSRSPRSRRDRAPSEDDGSCGDCIQLLSGVKDSLTLHKEENVRSTVQANIAELGAFNSAPPAVLVTSKPSRKIQSAPSCDDSSLGLSPELKLMGEAAIGASGRKQQHGVDRHKANVAADEDSIAAPKTKLSMTNCTDDIASASSKTESPKKSKSKRKKVKTPGSLVIPSPFTHNGKGLFPSTTDNYHARSSLHKSPPRPSDKNTRKMSPNSKLSKRGKDRSPMGMSLTMSTVSTADTSQTYSSGKLSEGNTAPPDMIRIDSSVEDLSTVQEVSVSKEKSCEDDLSNSVHEMPSSESGGTLAKAQEELRDELLKDSASQPQMEEENSVSLTPTDEAKQEHDRAVAELQDQVEHANRLAKMRLEEIERLETTMDGMRERQVEDSDLQRMKERLEIIQQEKRKAVEHAKQEMQILMERKIEEIRGSYENPKSLTTFDTEEEKKADDKEDVADNSSAVPPEDTKAVKKHNEKGPELEGKRSSDIVIMNSSKDEGVELMRVKRSENVKLAQASLSSKGSTGDADTGSSNRKDPVDSSICSPKLHAGKIIAVSPIPGGDIRRHQKAELLEQEMVYLKGQLALMEEQSVTVASEHERALFQLKKASETEIERVMTEMEARMQAQLEKERGLKETLSAAESREREELLEKIERLQTEKTTDRGIGLREVQRKEDLVRQIEAMQTKEHELVDMHEQALLELRNKNEMDLRRLHEQIEVLTQSKSFDSTDSKAAITLLTKRLEEEQEAKQALSERMERDILEKTDLWTKKLEEEQRERQALSEQMETIILEKSKRLEEEQVARKELSERTEAIILEKTEMLTKSLESEKEAKESLSQQMEAITAEKEASLKDLREKMGEALEEEKTKTLQASEATAKLQQQANDAAKAQQRQTEEIESSLKQEIRKLRVDLEERCALEDAMQITSNENEVLKEQIDRLTKELSTLKNSLLVEHKKAVEQLELDYSDKLNAAQNEGVRRLVETEASHKAQVEANTKKWQQELELVKAQESRKEQNFQERLVTMEKSYQAKIKNHDQLSMNAAKEAASKLASLEAEVSAKDKALISLRAGKASITSDVRRQLEQAKSSLSEKERQLQEVNESHSKQFEELLSQLDLVEAEHQDVLSSKEKLLAEKEATILGLGTQLRDAQNKVKESERNLVIEEERAFKLQRRCLELEDHLKSLKAELLMAKETHDSFVKEAAIAQERACEEAREEMIEKAEVQFRQANEHYIKLRKEYDESQSKVKKLESESRTTKKRLERLSKEKESCEVDLKAEVALLNAAIAKTEADAAQKVKGYRRELDEALQVSKDFEAKAEEAEVLNEQVQHDLSVIAAENAKLKQEYEEMKAVSEELMAMVEGQEQ